MSDRVDLEYRVQVTGLEEAQASANQAAASANQASAALNMAQAQSSSTLPKLLLTMRTVNSMRLAVTQTSKAITDLNPVALMYGFLSMIQVVRNLSELTKTLKDATGAAASAQAILATLTGHWYLIPLALAAGALIYSRVQSMQTGGPVHQTGLYMLHRGEYVVPAHQSMGPIFITFNHQPSPGIERDTWLNTLGEAINERIRRGG